MAEIKFYSDEQVSGILSEKVGKTEVTALTDDDLESVAGGWYNPEYDWVAKATCPNYHPDGSVFNLLRKDMAEINRLRTSQEGLRCPTCGAVMSVEKLNGSLVKMDIPPEFQKQDVLKIGLPTFTWHGRGAR